MMHTRVVEWTEETEQTTTEEPTTEYKEITEVEAKEIYCNDRQIYITNDKRNLWRVPCSGEYGSHEPTEQLYYRSIPKGEGQNIYFVKSQ